MMPLTTRNFALTLSLLAFVIVGISLGALETFEGKKNVGTVLSGVSLPEAEYEGVTISAPALDRKARVAELRQKIAALPAMAAFETETTEPEVPPTNPDPSVATLLLCPTYRSVVPTWQPGTVTFEVIEGARVLQSSVTDPFNPTLETTVVHLQLPLQTSADTITSCIPYDVIGVALDGSPILNSERDVYAIFGSETLIGYALDGFPIYGMSDSTADACGGLVSSGQYRYHLSPERETILHCFAGNPVGL